MPEAQSAAAAAIADARIPPGDDYEEIREQVRMRNIAAIKYPFLLTKQMCVGPLPSHCQHCTHHEEHAPRECQDCEGVQGDCAGVCIGVYLIHHFRSK